MEEKNKTQEKKQEKIKQKPEIKEEQKQPIKLEITPGIKQEKKIESPKEEKKEEPKKPSIKKVRVYLRDVPISTKQSVALCRFIKGKNPQKVLPLLEKVLKKKMAIPMRGEIPHRSGMPKGMPRGRYPVNATNFFIKALKNLIANAKVKLLDSENLIINFAKADKASRPIRATRLAFGGKHFKRSHVLIEAEEKEIKEKPKEKKK